MKAVKIVKIIKRNAYVFGVVANSPHFYAMQRTSSPAISRINRVIKPIKERIK